jgi:hypothetical protein
VAAQTSRLRDLTVHGTQGTRRILTAIRCGSCGAVVGVLPHEDVGAYVFKIAEKLDIK